MRILGTSPDSIDLAEDRQRFAASCGSRHSSTGKRHGDVARGGARGCRADRFPGGRAAVVRAGRPRDGDRLRHGHARSLHDPCGRRLAGAPDPHRQVSRRRLRVRRGCGGRRDRGRGDRRHHGAHRGGRHPLRRQLLRRAALHLPRAPPEHHPRLHAAHRPGAQGRRPDERPVRDQGRCGVRARGEPARLADGALPVEGQPACPGEGSGARDGRPNAGRPRSDEGHRGRGRLRQEPGVSVRPVPGRGYDSRTRDEVDRRGDGRRRTASASRSRKRSCRWGSGCRSAGPRSSA